jgi:hypothetical protein
MNAQSSVAEILHRLLHCVAVIMHNQVFQGRSLSKILYLS